MQTKLKTNNRGSLFKGFLYLAIAAAFFYAGTSLAAGTTGGATDLSGLVTNVSGTFEQIAKLMIAVCYLAGIGFVVSSIFKFKQHKDNPTQIPLGTPMALLVIGIALIFLPALIGPIGKSIFGDQADKIGGFKGELGGIPGASKTGTGS